MTRKDEERIKSIVDCIERIEEYIGGRTNDDLSSDDKTKDAVKWNIENISEEVTNISEDTKENNPEIDWDKITSIRIKYVHKYWELRFEVVRETCENIINQKEDFKIIIEQD